MKDSEGEVKIDKITGRKIRRKKLIKDDYEQDDYGRPIRDQHGRPVKKKSALKRDSKGELISETETEYEIDIVTG